MTILAALWVLSLALAVVLALALLARAGAGRALGAAALGVALYGFAGDALWLARQLEVAGWQPVEARVVVSERGRGRNDWRFAYTYTWQGEEHRASQFTFRPRMRSREDTDRLAERYPEGRTFIAYADPDAPSNAVVQKQPDYRPAALGFALHAALAATLVRAWRRGPAASAADGAPGSASG